MHNAQCCLTCTDSVLIEALKILECKNRVVIKDVKRKKVNPFGCCFEYNDDTLTENEREAIVKNFLERVCHYEHVSIWE